MSILLSVLPEINVKGGGEVFNSKYFTYSLQIKK